ncbi:hypothetical protein LX32DRAFT_318129 [Colletotrichum zoysiae]|uniref:Uncharacterized protein n=1 Tax=Colletotrichum zoysiae TaxID=1216348 RepID=A0AAD9M6R8_9PEZI|nr:hypothetical protein LX32DRAFT_318129 [Colletotrichum zoysiae]
MGRRRDDRDTSCRKRRRKGRGGEELYGPAQSVPRHTRGPGRSDSRNWWRKDCSLFVHHRPSVAYYVTGTGQPLEAIICSFKLDSINASSHTLVVSAMLFFFPNPGISSLSKITPDQDGPVLSTAAGKSPVGGIHQPSPADFTLPDYPATDRRHHLSIDSHDVGPT